MNPSAAIREVADRIREARLARGWSFQELHRRTKIPIEHLRALEEPGEGTDLSEARVRGRIRICAREVGVDVQELMAAWEPRFVPVESPPPAPDPSRVWLTAAALFWSESRWRNAVLACGGVLVLIVVLALGQATRKSSAPVERAPDWVLVEPEPVAAADTARPGKITEPEVEAYPVLELRQVDIESLMSGAPTAGDRAAAKGRDPIPSPEPPAAQPPAAPPSPVPVQAAPESPTPGWFRRAWSGGWSFVQATRARIVSVAGSISAWVERLQPDEPVEIPVQVVETPPVVEDPETTRLREAFEKARADERRWEAALNLVEPIEGDAEALRRLPDIARHSTVQAMVERIGKQEALLARIVREMGADHPMARRVAERLRQQRGILDQVVLQFPGLIRQKYQNAIAERRKAQDALGPTTSPSP